MGLNTLRYLPPLACDYSGAAAVLFPLPALNIVYAASICTQSIAEWDEIRDLRQMFLFHSMFGELEAVMGTDAEFLTEAELLSRKYPIAEFVTIISTPVPAIVGSDLGGLAVRLETKIKKPVVVINTTGFESYYSGVAQTLVALAEKFLSQQPQDPQQINLLGYTPLSLGVEANLKELVLALTQQGFKTQGLPQHLRSLDDFRRLTAGTLNLVLTHEGVALAQLLWRKYQIPYLLSLPVGISGLRRLLEQIGVILNKSLRLPSVTKIITAYQGKTALVIGEPLVASAVTGCLQIDFGIDAVAVSTQPQERRLKAAYRESELSAVRYVHGEVALQQLVTAMQPSLIIGDPLYQRFLECEAQRYLPLPQFGLSGHNFADVSIDYIGEAAQAWLTKQLR